MTSSPHAPPEAGFLKRSAATSAIVVLGRLPGLVIPIAIARLLGATAGTDAFFFAFAVTSFVIGCLAAAVEQVSVPFLVEARRSNQSLLGARYLLSVLGFGVLLLGVASLIIEFVPGLHPGLAGEDLRRLHRWLLPYAILTMLSSVLVGMLLADGRYQRAAAWNWIPGLIVVGSIALLHRRLGVESIALGYIAGEAVRLAALFLAGRDSLKGQTAARPAEQPLRPVFVAGITQVVGSAILGLAPLIDRHMIAPLGTGGVTILSYADRLWGGAATILGSGVLMAGLSEWSRKYVDARSHRDLFREVSSFSRRLLLLCVPVALAALLLRKPITLLLFGTGRMTVDALTTAADTFGALILCLPVYVAGISITRGLIITKRTDILLWIALVEIALKVGLNSLLLPRLGVPGVAASTSAMYGVGLALHWMALRQVCSRKPMKLDPVL